jgi:hypothetical protein
MGFTWTAFLHFSMANWKDLYVEQPPGFIEKGKERLVVNLSSSIYGLKQSAHVWNKKVNLPILEQGFSQSKADLNLYFRKEEDGSTSYILIYADDILEASKHASIIDEICRHFN